MALPMIEAKAISKSARIGIGAAMQILMILLWGFGVLGLTIARHSFIDRLWKVWRWN